MNQTEMLEALIEGCKGSVTVEVNPHRGSYLTVEQWLATEGDDQESPEICQRMVELDRVVCVQFYPNTPIGFLRTVHHDLGAALGEALQALAALGAKGVEPTPHTSGAGAQRPVILPAATPPPFLEVGMILASYASPGHRDRVVSIYDGDTPGDPIVDLRDEGGKIRCRLSSVVRAGWMLAEPFTVQP